MLTDALARFPRLELITTPTPLEHLPRLSRHLGRDIWIKRDDLTPLALGGNKARKLEYLGADALAMGADVLVTAGAIQSNHVRQTAALAARQGLGCLALLENPLGTNEDNYLGNGNRLLLDLFGSEVEAVANLDNADELLQASAERLRSAGRRPYVVPIGGSNALGALGYVRAGLELAEQMHGAGEDFAAVALASGSAGTHSGLALALAHARPSSRVVGVTVSRPQATQRPKVEGLLQRTAELLGVQVPAGLQVELWDQYFAPRYGERMPPLWPRSACWPNRKACCSIRFIPVRPSPACSTGWPGAPSPERARCCFCTPVVPRHCSPIIHGHWVHNAIFL
jgi:D-cysteine desulfhydrase